MTAPPVVGSARLAMHSTIPDVLKRSPERSCWFEDGSIVLQAQTTVFKVYKGLLSQESEFFKSMFTLPQPSLGPSESYEGCPLVALQDSAADVQAFVQAIFDPNFLVEQLESSSICASLLRMTTKYQAQRLRRRVMVPLSQAFPDTLSGYRSTTKARRDSHNRRHLSWNWSEHVNIANAARQSGTSILLPAFLLATCFRSMEDILQTSALGEVNRNAIITAIPKLSVAARTEVHSLLFSSARNLSPRCTQPDVCFRGRHALMKEIEERPNVFNPFHVHTLVVPRTIFQLEEVRLCQLCAAQIGDAENRMVAQWERLPEIFGLDTWDELRKAEKNAASESVD